MTKQLSKKIYLGALLGVFLEYMDYVLYGFSAPYLAKTFFPLVNPGFELVLSWAVFSVSFLARPFGAVIFGHLADRFGRRKILTCTILLMSVATISMGLLPGFQQIGLSASILLLFCRILQGLAVSTEYTGCSTYLLEFTKNRPGLVSGIVTSASGFGVFGGSLLVLLFNARSSYFFGIESWRWPFIVGGILSGILGLYFRRGLLESPAFLDLERQAKVVSFPLWYLLRRFPKSLIKGILVSAYVGMSIIIIEIYLPSYLQAHLGMAKTRALQFASYLSFIEAVFAISWGAFSDYIGRVKTFLIAGVLMIVGIVPLLCLLHQSLVLLWFVAATGLAVIVGAGDGPISVFLTESFPTEIRYTSVSVCYSLGVGIIGGLSPGLLEFFAHQMPHIEIIPWYLVLGACIMLFSLRIK